MRELNIVGVSGGLSSPSRTLALVALALRRVAHTVTDLGMANRTQLFDVAALEDLAALRARPAPDAVEAAFAAVERADLLVVGSPVYKGSYSGLFKHFFDFVEYRGLVGVPVALLATGGSDRHALVIEHQLRPLFGFFQAQPLGTGIFFTEREFAGGDIAEGAPRERFDRMVDEAVHALVSRIHAGSSLIGAAA